MAMHDTDTVSMVDPRTLSDSARDDLMAEVEKGQQLAGHFPSKQDMERVRGILNGEVSPEEAVAALEAQYPVVE